MTIPEPGQRCDCPICSAPLEPECPTCGGLMNPDRWGDPRCPNCDGPEEDE